MLRPCHRCEGDVRGGATTHSMHSEWDHSRVTAFSNYRCSLLLESLLPIDDHRAPLQGVDWDGQGSGTPDPRAGGVPTSLG